MADFLDQLRRLSLVVVDDNATHRLIAAEALRGLGAGRVHHAENAAALFDVARAAPIDLLLCDWQMRDVDGITLTRQIRAGETPLPRDIPVVMVTSQSTAGAVARAVQAGADEFVAKPYAVATLAARFEAVVMNRRPFIRAAAYVGPCRRRRESLEPTLRRRLFDDAPQAPATAPWAQALEATLVEVRSLARTAVARDRATIRRLHTLIHGAGADARAHADPATRAALEGLRHYIDGVGASAAFEGKVIETHAAGVIEMLRHADAATRARMAEALGHMVRKRLVRAAS
ncbi:MAG: response regulator [Alphaproteobacteria bacterium]|nr:response regulator [Alphaproteobacteria bacterium]